MKGSLKKVLKESVKGVISFNEDLRRHTTFKIGGRPAVWVEPKSLEDLIRALKIFAEMGLKPLVIGNGSNMLVNDGRIDRAVIRLKAPYFRGVAFGDDFVICKAGHNLAGLIKRCIENGLSGLEKLAGIPGTVGGAIMLNAGTKDSSIGDLVEWVRAIDYKGEGVLLFEKERLRFKYRESGLSKYIILEARLILKKDNPAAIQRRFDESLKKKMAAQEYRWPSAGCVFKNPSSSTLTSGQLLQRCGLKGLRINDAAVSNKHANFIVNRGTAHFSDVMSLIKLEQKAVKKNFGIDLELEIDVIK